MQYLLYAQVLPRAALPGIDAHVSLSILGNGPRNNIRPWQLLDVDIQYDVACGTKSIEDLCLDALSCSSAHLCVQRCCRTEQDEFPRTTEIAHLLGLGLLYNRTSSRNRFICKIWFIL